jgi:hypothetical protein
LKLAVLNTSVVVLAETHNPTILHPIFLLTQGIVPKDWQLAEPPVCTPAISVAKFANGIVFTAELTKFQIMDNLPAGDSPVPEMVVKYLEKLPHVHYTAVGININGYVECQNPEDYISNRFVQHGPWTQAPLQATSVGLKFTFPIERGALNLRCDAGTVRKAEDKTDTSCLVVGGNYHVDLVRDNPLEDAKSVIGTYRQRVAHFDQITQIVFGLET